MAYKVERYEDIIRKENQKCRDPSHFELNNRLECEINEHKQTILENNKEFQILISKISLLEQQLKESTQDRIEKLNESASFIERLNKRIETLNEEINNERDEKNKAEGLCKSFASKLHILLNEKEDLKLYSNDLQSQIKILKSKLDEIPELKKKFNTEEIKSQSLEDDKALLQDKLKSMQLLSKNNSKLSTQIKEYENKISELEKELLSKSQRLEVFRNYK